MSSNMLVPRLEMVVVFVLLLLTVMRTWTQASEDMCLRLVAIKSAAMLGKWDDGDGSDGFDVSGDNADHANDLDTLSGCKARA